MAVKIGSARINEYGTVSGGKAGDQTGGEVATQNWYLHSKGWYVAHFSEAAVREKIAKDMEYACANNNIGYCQDHRETARETAAAYNFDLSKVGKKVEVDCSKLVQICLNYAGISAGDFTTGNFISAVAPYVKKGVCTVYKDDAHCKSSVFLVRGDILVTRTKGHIVVVLSNGAKAISQASSTGSAPKPASGVNTIVRDGQIHANNFSNAGIDADGIRGPKTKVAGVKVLQQALNSDYRAGLEVDGIWGNKSEKALGKHYVKKGETQYMVTAVEILLMLKGYDPKGLENPGKFGSGLESAVKQYQKDHGLKVDGIAGHDVLKSLIA